MKKTILITGASSGIGKATALYFSKEGWNVIATMRRPEGETDLNHLPNVLVTRIEVTDISSIDQAIKSGIERFGKIDVLLNNAGYGQIGLFEAISMEKVMAQFNVNVFGTMNLIRRLLPHFRANNSGTIINISSTVGVIAMPMVSIYSASKFAIEGFSESLAYELDPLNIRVKLIEPGSISTNFSNASAAEFAYDPSLVDYNVFTHKSNNHNAKLDPDLYSDHDVAKVIFTAATDDSPRLRYIAGPDAEKLIKMKESQDGEQYLKKIRAVFAPDGFRQNPSSDTD